ncbi:hypothetical protein [Mycobacteroides abscessus]|uniref:hypothetical protein n=1 Tax=Mycobacteroides abscessus TaxID=36809 RepID=UPI0013001664|nr:hypothetical protein [Mycobacteroides abscessus]
MTTPTQSPLWRYRLVVGAAAVLAVLALVLTIIRWAAPAVNTTITTAAPTYTEDRVAAAKKTLAMPSTEQTTP